MSLVEPPEPGNPPKQRRSRRTLEKIVAAALRMVEEGGVGTITVAGVVRRAAASVGSFYARFEGRDDFLRYLRWVVLSRRLAEWRAALRSGERSGGTLTNRVESLVDRLASVFDFGEGGLWSLFEDEQGEGRQLLMELHERLLKDVVGLVESWPEVGRDRRSKAAITFGYWMVVGGLQAWLRFSRADADTRPEEATATIRQTYAEAWAHLLGGGRTEGPRLDQTAADFFDPWS